MLFLSTIFYSFTYCQNINVHRNSNFSKHPESVDSLLLLHYDGDNNGYSIGDQGSTFIGGARFKADTMQHLTGGYLTSVQFHYSEPATGLSVLIFGDSTNTVPGDTLYFKKLNISSLIDSSWNSVTLDSGLLLSGKDLWVCIQVEDSTGLNYPLGCDDGPADVNGDWVNDSGIWKHLNNDYGLNYNWNIRAEIETPVTNVKEIIGAPVVFSLSQNYPNPFNPTTEVTFNVPQSGNVILSVYNIIGQQVGLLANGMVTAGSHTVTFNAKSLPSGVYFYRLQQGNSVMIKKMLLMK